MTQKYAHIILTRFNVKSKGKESKIRLQPNWLDNRFKLFETYCFPSICKQSNKNFIWLIYFDIDTPEEYKQRITDLANECEQLNPFYIDEWNKENVDSAILSLIAKDRDFLLTTRLDNDDGLHPEFVETLQRGVESKHNKYYNFPYGMTFAAGYAYSHKDNSNAFLSRIESVKNFKTAWEKPHPEVIKTENVEQLNLKYAWLQVIHGQNVSNKIRGAILNPENWHKEYSFLEANTISRVTAVKYMSDNLVFYPIRQLRDLFISIYKTLF